MTPVEGQELIRTLRDTPERRVFLCAREGVTCVTRVLRASTVPRHFERVVRHAALQGRGSIASLGDEIAMTLEGYAVAARLLADPGVPPRWPRAVDAGVTVDGHVYLSTTWIDGTPLHELAEPLSLSARGRATEAILDILAELHARRVAYGDLKLSNLVLRPDGGVGLIDLDTIREVPAADVGAPSRDRTRGWAAPEQLERGETWIGSDTWALARVLTALWGEELPAPWREPIRACRARDPRCRPTIVHLRQRLLDPSAPLLDTLGRDCSSVDDAAPEPGAERVPVGATERAPVRSSAAERVPEGGGAGATERVPEGASVGTERVPEPGSGAVSDSELPAGSGAGGAQAPPSGGPGWQRGGGGVPPRSAPPGARASGCRGILVGLSQAAFAAIGLGGLALCSLGTVLYLWAQNAADEEAERLMAELKVHKTDIALNGKVERDRLAKEAEGLWENHETPRTCAVRALAMVWQQRWQFDTDWSQADFDAASSAVSEVKCLHEPEAMLAKATLYAGACRRRTHGVISPTDCELAMASLEPFWAALPPGDEHNWLRVEAAWQEVRARSALAGRYVETGNAEADIVGEAAIAHCRAAEPWMPYAPVNGPELQEECLVVAGFINDVPAYLHFADLRLANLPTDRKARASVFTHLYTAAGIGCADAKFTYNKKGQPVTSGGQWCLALGDLARGCTDEAGAEMVDGAGDNAHAWAMLSTALATRSGPCLQ